MPDEVVFDAEPLTSPELPIPPEPLKGRRGGRRGVRRVSNRTPLRIKLITLLFALVGIALSVIGFVTVLVFSGYLQNQADTQLTGLQNQVLAEYSPQSQPGYHQPLVVSPTNVAEFIPAGSSQPVRLTLRPPSLPLPVIPQSQSWVSANAGHPVTVSAASGNYDWRVIVQSVTFQNANTQQTESGTLVVGVNLFNLHESITYLTRLDVGVSVAILIVLVVVGIGVVQANLRPLNDIEMIAGEIAKGHLDHRIPERDPRTEVGSLGRSLNAMLSQIERAFHSQEAAEQSAHESEERMRRFIADAAHELRTPLTTIRGFAAHYRQRGGARGFREQGSSAENQNLSSRTSAAIPAFATGGPSGGHSESAGESAEAAVIGTVIPTNGAGTKEGGTSGAGEAGEPAGEDLDHLMARVESEATRMGLLVEDLLTLARLDQQRPLAMGPVDLLTLAVDAVQDARIVSPNRPIDLVVAPGTAFIVNGDEPRLRQVLANLVNNALTHTPAGTPIRVKIGSGTVVPPSPGNRDAEADRGDAPDAFAATAAEAGGAANAATGGPQPVPAVVLDVEDDGPGMEAGQAQRVFERFYRADAARNRASGGTGLGLAIVAGLVAAHGGTVAVRTEPGHGADFQVRLPLSPDVLNADPEDE